MVRNKKGNEATKATLGERQHSYKGNKAQKTARHSKQQGAVDSKGTERNKAQNTTQHTGLPRQNNWQQSTIDSTTDKASRHRTQHNCNAATMVTRPPSQQGYQGITAINEAQKTTQEAKNRQKGYQGNTAHKTGIAGQELNQLCFRVEAPQS